MDKSYNDKIRPLLDLADTLPSLLKGTNIKIPRIASCGMQSHGKSSTLESITHISLPKGDGTVTICPIKISLRKAKDKEYARIKFELDNEEKYETIKLDEISDKIMEYQNKVKKENNVKEKETKLFDKVIQVEVNRKNAPNLTLYDMPGINFNEEIQKTSEEINEKYLKEKETTVLLVISGSEEPLNCYSTKWMQKIPDYKKRFNAIITKADLLTESSNDKIGNYLEQIKKLELENPPSLLINKYNKYKNFTNMQMQGEELKLISKIPNIDKYPNVNKGIEALIDHLIKIQKDDLIKAFSDIANRIRKELIKNKEVLQNFPSNCETKEQFLNIFQECLKKIKAKIKSKKEKLKCKEDGNPTQNLLKYDIQLKFRNHIKEVKLKMNKLLTLPFCNQVTNNIIQYNSDNIPLLEDITTFNILLKPQVEEILSDFESTINDIFDYMVNNIKLIIKESFEDFKKLGNRVNKLYLEYAAEQKKKILDFYKEIYFLETENISAFNISIIDKVNNLNKHINFKLFGKNTKLDKKILKLGKKILKYGLQKIVPSPFNQIIDLESTGNDVNFYEFSSNIKSSKNENNKYDKKEELILENNNKTKKIEKKKKIEEKIEENEKIEKDEKLEEITLFQTINNFISEVIDNKNYSDTVKKKYQEYSSLIKSQIINNYNYKNEREVRNFNQQIFTGRIKIAYTPSEIDTFYDKIIDEEILKLTDIPEAEFIPGFQYVSKEKLEEFQKLIAEGKVQIKTANVITKMVAYLEVMLNRNLDIIFLSIQKYLYDRLTDDEMINVIGNKIYLLDFKKCKKLVEVNPNLTKKREECTNNIKNLKEALRKIREIKNDKNNIFIDDDFEEVEEKEEEEEEGEKKEDKKDE